MKMCSACLIGEKCRYDGKDNLDKASPRLLEEYRKGEIKPVCPEQLGGLPTPRAGSRIVLGDGNYVLDGKSTVLTDDFEDVTEQYLKGAERALQTAKDNGITEAILKQGSPSCGCGYTQGGLGERKQIEGDGVTAALLKRNGISVKTEKDFL